MTNYSLYHIPSLLAQLIIVASLTKVASDDCAIDSSGYSIMKTARR